MKSFCLRPVHAALPTLLLIALPLQAQQPEPPGDDQNKPNSQQVEWDVLERYCQDCHNFTDQAGSIAFDILPQDHLRSDAAIWEKAIRKIRTGLMPPAGEPRPSPAVLNGLVDGLEAQLDAEWRVQPDPGNEGNSRLNRTEYANAIRDLLAFDALPLMAKLPADDPAGLFDNMADELSVSPTLMEGYVSTAMRISREAVGDMSMVSTQLRFEAPAGEQNAHVDGLPLGSRGGFRFEHTFPLDAKYDIRIESRFGSVFGGVRYCEAPAIVFSVDGELHFPEDPEHVRLSLTAGPHTLAVALMDDRRCPGANELYDNYRIDGSVTAVEVHGPYAPSGPGDTPSRRAIFSCYPKQAAEESACARAIVSQLATRAWRRPVDEDDPALVEPMRFYGEGRALGDFETGVQYGLSRLLVDPRFLYRLEREPDGLAPGELYRVSDLELASRLSFFLWSSIPDEELLALASAGRLSEPTELRRQVDRMLADPRALALVDNFASQWLQLRALDDAQPQDPAFNDRLRADFRRETELLFTDILRQDLGILRLLDADYSWLNERLAKHYGITNVRGDYMRRVSLPSDSPRRGLLGHGSLLTATSVANRTSPVIRGEWIVDNLLGAPVPVPPPGVEADLTAAEGADSGPQTLRQRLEMHLQVPSCASCHQIMDPVGFALENFDLIGRWRESDNGLPLDTHARLVDGTPIHGPSDLREALLARGPVVATSFTEKLLSYALGRELRPDDMPAVRAIVEGARAKDYRFSVLVQGIVASLPFQWKIKEKEAES